VGDKYVGYHQFASVDELQYDKLLFIAETVEEAVIFAQEEETEYGYRFINL